VILIAYDGSDDAKAAIEQAAKLFQGKTTTVLTVWQRYIDTMARIGGGTGLVMDYEEIDKDSAKLAAERAEEGANLAQDSGLQASTAVAVVDSTIADAILNEANSAGAQAVVCGSRGYSGIKSLMLGSVSSHILQHADVPVVVVPSPAVAKARTAHRESLK
jgi:nucleotide-binding universal stress UspA family protein